MDSLFPDAPQRKACAICGNSSKQLPRNNDWCRRCLARARRNAPPGKAFCTKCKDYFPRADFITGMIYGKVRLSSWCKKCDTAHKMNHFKEQYDATRYRDRNLRQNHGISLVEYTAMLEAQGGVCAICKLSSRVTEKGKLRPLSVDHCHVTGAIRGLLCDHCNRALGGLASDPYRTISLLRYIVDRCLW